MPEQLLPGVRTMQKRKVVIGIDPSTTQSGLSVCTSEGVDGRLIKSFASMKVGVVDSFVKRVIEIHPKETCDIFGVIEDWSIPVSKTSPLHTIKALERAKQFFITVLDYNGIPCSTVNASTWQSAFHIHHSRGDTKAQSMKICMDRYGIIGVNNDIADAILISVYGFKRV